MVSGWAGGDTRSVQNFSSNKRRTLLVVPVPNPSGGDTRSVQSFCGNRRRTLHNFSRFPLPPLVLPLLLALHPLPSRHRPPPPSSGGEGGEGGEEKRGAEAEEEQRAEG